MRIITEAELRDQYKKAEFTSYRMPEGTRLTPSAQQFLSERRIKILTDTEGKPEHMTHINGKTLVPKNHPRIRFRGKLDYLQAVLIGIIIDVEGHGYRELAGDLGEVLEYFMQIMSAEVKEEPLEPLNFHGLSPTEIREQSHHPHRFFGVSHIFPRPGNGKLMAQLNLLRTEVRALELVAMDAFYGQPEGQDRSDIMESLNRLSSLVYVFMLQLASGKYAEKTRLASGVMK